MSQPSIGDAIALQGQSNNTLRMAQSLGQGLARKAAVDQKKQLADQAAAQKQEDQLMSYFKDKGRMHRLALPEMNEIFDETLNEIQKIKSSGNPWATNDYSRIERNLRGRLVELDSYSNALTAFDKQVDYIDPNKKYYGDKLPEFLSVYRKSKSLKDLKNFTEQNPDFFDDNLKFDPNGIPLLTEQTALPILEDLTKEAKNLKEVISYRDLVSVPGVKNTENMRSVYGKPLYIKDSEEAFKNNSNFFKQRPTSLEDLVDEYLIMYGETAIKQASTKFNLGLVKGAEGYTDQDKQKVKDVLIPYMAQFSNPELKDKIIKEGAKFSFNMGNDKAGPNEISIGLANQELLTPGDVVDDRRTTNEEQKIPRKIRTLATIEVNSDGAFLQNTDQLRDQFGNKASGDFDKALIVGIRLMPYRLINGIKVPARNENAKEIEGVTPFVQFNAGPKNYFTPLTAYADKTAFAGTKYKAESFSPVFMEFYKLEDRINKAIKEKQLSKRFANQKEFDNFVKPYLTK
jgi:hypothetical protein